MPGGNSSSFFGEDFDDYVSGYGERVEVTQKPRKKEARNFAKQIIKHLQITEAPINLRFIIEHLQVDYSLYVTQWDFSDNISGILVKISDLEDDLADSTYAIGFNKDDPWCRRRFTICHEIGHLLFNSSCTKYEGGGSSFETECDCFAAELLMPKAILKKDFDKVQDVPTLAKMYLVSEQALCIKLGDDRLLKL